MFKNKEGKLRSGWKIAIFTAAMFATIILLSVFLFLIIGIIFISRGKMSLDSLATIDSDIVNQFNFYGMFLQEIVMIIAPIFTWRIIMKKPLSTIGLGSFKCCRKDFIVGLLFGIISMTLVFFSIILFGSAELQSWKPQFSFDTFIYFILFILVGFAEEIYGRGFIMSTLRQTKSYPVIVIVSSILFALMHSGNAGIGLLPYINLALVGILFAYMYLKLGNIWMCIGFHITWNYFQGNVYGFKVSGLDTQGILTTTYQDNNIWNGGAFGPEGGLFVTVVLLLGFLFLKTYKKEQDYNFMAVESQSAAHQIEEPVIY